MHEKCSKKMGCLCKLCMADAYNDYMDSDVCDPEVADLIMEIVVEDYSTQDIEDVIKHMTK